jgi:hypothetical protein
MLLPLAKIRLCSHIRGGSKLGAKALTQISVEDGTNAQLLVAAGLRRIFGHTVFSDDKQMPLQTTHRVP